MRVVVLLVYFWYSYAMLVVDEIKAVKIAVENGLDMDDAIRCIVTPL